MISILLWVSQWTEESAHLEMQTNNSIVIFTRFNMTQQLSHDCTLD